MARKKKTLSIEEILDNERNVAAVLDRDVLDRIGSVVVDDFKKDKDSRADWEERSKDIMKLALQVVEDKNYPWPNAANVKYPLLTLSAVQFASRVDLFQGPDVVKVETTGWDGDGLKYDRALRIQKHMSWQLTKQMRGWDDDNDRMMHALPIIGAMFKKTYYCPVKEHNVSELVYPDLLVFDYWAKDVETAIRKTQILSLNQNDIHERVASGVYSDVDLGDPSDPLERPLGEEHEGVTSYDDEDAPFRILEQHRSWDLDGDGYKEPYVITVDEGTKKVLRICPRFIADGVKRNDRDEIKKIEPIEYYTQYTFIPDPSGGNLGIGFGHLQGPLNEVANTLINQLLDAGTINNLQGGFIGKGLRTKAGEWAFEPGEWKMVQSTGEDISKNIVPLPTKEPSQVLFLLLQLITQAAERVGSITDAIVGDQPAPNTPATSTLATIEQGLKVFKKIHKRLYSAFTKEFNKLYHLNSRYMDEKEYFEILDIPMFQMQRLLTVTRGLLDLKGVLMVLKQDYASDFAVYPSADPNVMTEMERMKKLEVLLQTMPLGWNPEELKIRFVEALNIPNPDRLLQPPPPPPPDPKIMVEQMRLQFDGAKLQADMQVEQAKIGLEAQKQQADIEKTKMEVAKIEAEIRQILSEIQKDPTQEKAVETQYKLVELQAEHRIKQQELELKKAELGLKQQEMMLNGQSMQHEQAFKEKELNLRRAEVAGNQKAANIEGILEVPEPMEMENTRQMFSQQMQGLGGMMQQNQMQMAQALQSMMQGITSEFSKSMMMLDSKIMGVKSDMDAPKTIKRDKQGKIVQVGKKKIKRDAAGRVAEVG